MPTYNFTPQSYRWSSYRIIVDDAVEMAEGQARNVRLEKREAGNLTIYTISPHGAWQGMSIDYSGEVSVSRTSKNDAIIALASSGSWSGGSNYRGWIFGKPGAVIFFNRKGNKAWYMFTESGIEIIDIEPGTVPVEL